MLGLDNDVKGLEASEGGERGGEEELRFRRDEER